MEPLLEGCTVTVIVFGTLGQAGVVVEVAVTKYCMVPAVEVLELLNIWLIVFDEVVLADAPVIPPVTVPIVQVKVLGWLDVSAILLLVLLQMVFVALFVTTGVGLTEMVKVLAVPVEPVQFVEGVTVIVSITTLLVLLIAVKLGILPVPDGGKPIEELVPDHEYCTPATVGVLVKLTAFVLELLQTVWLFG